MNKPMNATNDVVMRASHIAKTYEEGDLKTDVLSDVSFALKRGETMARSLPTICRRWRALSFSMSRPSKLRASAVTMPVVKPSST